VALAAAAACLAPAGASAAQHLGQRALRYGDRGHDVRVLQGYLTQYGLKTSVSGYFGSVTRTNVVAFEREEDLVPNTVFSKHDAQVLRDAVETGGSARYIATPPPTGKARLNPDGTATAPSDAPPAVQAIIAAGNRIAHKPYIYGGGHGTGWNAAGYDCSGSVSYVLHAAHLLRSPLTSGGFESYGLAGRGRWVSIYANAGHAWMRVAGLRFDTSGLSADGTRWHATNRPSSGYVIRHVSGL
jgi:cell wall-associated NlpC family hydrolase